MRTYIKVPIKIITPKLAQNKQDSIFYAGTDIAEVKVRNRTYVLTTAGYYSFSLEEDGFNYIFDSVDPRSRAIPKVCKAIDTLTDKKINALEGLVSNWGWFGINVWETRPNIPGLPGQDQYLTDPTEVWSDYDEALSAFIKYVEKDLNA